MEKLEIFQIAYKNKKEDKSKQQGVVNFPEQPPFLQKNTAAGYQKQQGRLQDISRFCLKDIYLQCTRGQTVGTAEDKKNTRLIEETVEWKRQWKRL